MRAGPLRHRVEIQRPVEGQDALGSKVVSWTKVAEVWADVQAIGGTETESVPVTTSRNTITARVRYLDGVETAWRIVFAGRNYDVTGIENPGFRNVQLILTAVEAT